ncbi:conserved hypothetical protein [Microcystis aeruginosa PCC 9807]|uniref:Uncharacterized protein n=2 Tax=Microcystis aeruginosa TaxID=1126 RepID=I4H758_MICAE|nr:hypothetical protein BH695_2799 [Microcystis aeruginosa PCC 7806SL]CCI17882.1 conserved hypothetical protein [Microcystis aeruginosa PCC 9807]
MISYQLSDVSFKLISYLYIYTCLLFTVYCLLITEKSSPLP